MKGYYKMVITMSWILVIKLNCYNHWPALMLEKTTIKRQRIGKSLEENMIEREIKVDLSNKASIIINASKNGNVDILNNLLNKIDLFLKSMNLEK